jgi:hypothetical protein
MNLNPGTMDKTTGGCCSLLPPLLARPRLARHEHAEEREVCCIDSVPTETWPSGASCFGSGAGHLGDVGLVTFNKDNSGAIDPKLNGQTHRQTNRHRQTNKPYKGSGASHPVGGKNKMPVCIVTTSQVIRISLFMSQDPSPRVT